MDVGKLIERLRTESLYKDKATLEIMDLCMDAAQTLENLQIELKAMRGAANSYKAENARLESELEKVKAERDAAVSDLETVMAYGGGNLDTCQFCKNAQCYARGGAKPCLPQWRGQKEE